MTDFREGFFERHVRLRDRVSRKRIHYPLPVPTWTRAHCGYIHHPADLLRLNFTDLECRQCEQPGNVVNVLDWARHTRRRQVCPLNPWLCHRACLTRSPCQDSRGSSKDLPPWPFSAPCFGYNSALRVRK